MAPNSEESSRIGQFPVMEDTIAREKQRPPIYNAEDYSLSLKKWGKKTSNGPMVPLYSAASTPDIDCNRSHNHTFRDYRNPMLLTSSDSEMTLRQFGTVTELLAKLKVDLRLAYPSKLTAITWLQFYCERAVSNTLQLLHSLGNHDRSLSSIKQGLIKLFVQEFVGDPLDGITLLLDLLRAIQLSQSNNAHQVPGSGSTIGKIPPSVQRRALLDELSCLQCLLSCCTRYAEAVRKLSASSASLFTLAICIMSNVNKTRIIALQLLTKACLPSQNGHNTVSEAMSTLRLRFGEPTRFRFLVGILTSAGGQKELLVSGMKFINTFLDTAATPQKRLYIQAELEQAGFDITVMKKNIGSNVSAKDEILKELDHWEKHHIDVGSLTIRAEHAERNNDSLRDKILLLERKVQILQEEKGILVSLEQCLKDRCSELQSEVRSLRSGSVTHNNNKKDVSPSADDEGISSSERSPSPPDELPTDTIFQHYSVDSVSPTDQNKYNKEEDDEEETTIDEVIEELRNIINDAETEAYVKEDKLKQEERKRIEEAQVKGKLMNPDIYDYTLGNESEIIPSNIYPQPPRKARSLVHLFLPAEDYEYCSKEMFFENETAFTSEEGSDSLLSASKCQLPRVDKDISQNNHRLVLDTREKPKAKERTLRRCSSKTSIKRSDSFRHVEQTTQFAIKQNVDKRSYYYNTPTTTNHQRDSKTIEEIHASRVKSKSLDRIDDGLDSMVDIVVTDHNTGKTMHQFRTKSDSGNVSATSLSRSISNVFITPSKPKLSCHSEEKQRMFLPLQRDTGDVPYYFPRIQEKRSSTSSSFLIKRGHTNAGLYSGQIIHTTQQQSVTKNDYIPTRNSSLTGKVTDLPCGLY